MMASGVGRSSRYATILRQTSRFRPSTRQASTPVGGCNSRTKIIRSALHHESRQSHQRRCYMDVHQRPSHSRMFDRPGNQAAKPSHTNGQGPSLPPTPPLKEPDTAVLSEYGLAWLYLRRAAMAMGVAYAVTEYVGDVTMCEGPSMHPTIEPAGDIIWMDKWFIRRHVCSLVAEDRAQVARQRQDEDQQTKQSSKAPRSSWWHEPRIPVNQLPRPTSWWQAWRRDLWPLLTTPLSIGDVVVLQHPQRPGTVCKRVLGLPGDQVILRQSGHLVVVPDGHIWVEGDNPNNSSDSRHYGPVPASLIIGRVLCRVWPLRGNAILRRGWRPRVPDRFYEGSTVLPAGYQGERIVKTLTQEQERQKVKDAE